MGTRKRENGRQKEVGREIGREEKGGKRIDRRKQRGEEQRKGRGPEVGPLLWTCCILPDKQVVHSTDIAVVCTLHGLGL